VAHLNTHEQHLVQGKKYRNLQDHGQAAAQGIDFVGLVEVHDLLVHGGRIAFVLFLELDHLWLQLLHVLHGFETLLGNGPEDYLEDDGDQDDGDSVIIEIRMEKIQ